MKNLNHLLLVGVLLAMIPFTGTAQKTVTVVPGPVNVSKNINVSVVGEPLNAFVNSPYKEYGPMPSKDNRLLYFSRQGAPENIGDEYDEDIWYSEFDEETQSWRKAMNIGQPLNNKGPNFVCGVGSKGDTLLLGNVYGKKGKMSAGVSVSIRKDNVWSMPQPLKIVSDYNFSKRAGFDLSHDRKALIIAEEKADSHGKLDLYVALRDPRATYAYSGKESINLGPVINTSETETSPWLSYDGRTLYFSSDGHAGYGKLDIFVSKRLDSTWTNWSEPTNLGVGINSLFDDRSFNFNPDSRYAYYSRGLSTNNSDIFRVEMTQLFKGLEVTKGVNDFAPEIGQARVIAHVFDENQSEIKTSALPDLLQIVEYLKKNTKIIVKVNAHSNQHQSRNESMLLSNQRASNVMDMLIKNGIDKGRLSFTGLGHDIVINSPGLKSGTDEIDSSVEFKFINFSFR